MTTNNLYKFAQDNNFDAMIEFNDEVTKESSEFIFDLIVIYGSVEDMNKYYNKLNLEEEFKIYSGSIRFVMFNFNKTKFLINNNLVLDDDLYKIISFNYNCIKFTTKEYKLNIARIISKSKVSFRYIVDEFLELGYNYKDMVTSYYNGYNMLAYILHDKENVHDSNDLIKFFETLYLFDIELLKILFRISYKKTMLNTAIGQDTELYKKIIRYIKGRKLTDLI